MFSKIQGEEKIIGGFCKEIMDFAMGTKHHKLHLFSDKKIQNTSFEPLKFHM
jgi:hypothetical protein